MLNGMNSTNRYEIINQDDMVCAYAQTLADARHARDTYVATNPIRLRAYVWDVWAKKEVK
jgi:hypothetical protein